jgi:hypothetical protein
MCAHYKKQAMCKNKNLTEKHSLILHKKKYKNVQCLYDKLKMFTFAVHILAKVKVCPINKNLYDEVSLCTVDEG